MNTKAKHILGSLRVDGLTIEGPDGNICLMNLARDEEQTKAYAAFIVRACNAHDELVVALERAKAAIKEAVMLSATSNGAEYSFKSTIEKISAALAKAKGEA